MSSRPSRGAARLAAILDALPDALLLVNCNGTVVNANVIALEAFETPGTALVGRGLLDLLPEFDPNRIPGSMRRPDEDEGEARTKPTRMIARRTDGSEFPVEVTSANLEDGRTPYASSFEAAWADHGTSHYTGDELLMLVVRDLTGTLDTEAELARQQRQTEMILRAASEGVMGVDNEGRVVLVNPSAAQILGYRAGDLGGRELHPLVHHSRPDGSSLPFEETPLHDTLRSGRKHRVRAGQVLWAKDGSAVPVAMTTSPVRDGEQLVGAVLTFTDRRPYVALRERHEQLRAVLDEALRGPLDQLRDELGGLAADPAGQLWPEANQILHHLSAGYARMTTLVDNVLAYQRLQTGKDRLRTGRVSMDGVVAAGVDGAVELIGPGRAQFAVHAPPIEAEVDADRLATALAHLIADVAGVDATGTQSAATMAGDSTIVVAAAQRGDVIRIEVRGPHAGGSPVHQPVVRGIVERHGGVLQTHEVPGAGSSAYVLEVPCAASPGTGAGAAAAEPGADTEGAGTGTAAGAGAASGSGSRGSTGGTGGAGADSTGAGLHMGGPQPDNETTVMPVPAQPRRGTETGPQSGSVPAARQGGSTGRPPGGGGRGHAPAAVVPPQGGPYGPEQYGQQEGPQVPDGTAASQDLKQEPEHGMPRPTGRRRRGRPDPAEQAPGAGASGDPRTPGGQAPAGGTPSQGTGRRARRALAAPGGTDASQTGAGQPNGPGQAGTGRPSGPTAHGQGLPALPPAPGGAHPPAGAPGQSLARPPGPAGQAQGAPALPPAPGGAQPGPSSAQNGLVPHQIPPGTGRRGRREGPPADGGPPGGAAAPAPGTGQAAQAPAVAGGGRRARRLAAARARAEAQAAGQSPSHEPFALPPADADRTAEPGPHATAYAAAHAGGGAGSATHAAARTGNGTAPGAGRALPAAPAQARPPQQPGQPALPPGGHGAPGAGQEQAHADHSRVAASPILGGGQVPDRSARQDHRPALPMPNGQGQSYGEQSGTGTGTGTGTGISVRTLGQGVPFARQVTEHGRSPGHAEAPPAPAPAIPSTPSTPGQPTGAGRRRKLGAGNGEPAAAPGQGTVPAPQQGTGREFAIGAPDAGAAEGPEPLDGPNGAVEVTEGGGTGVTMPLRPVDDELPPEPLDNPRRLLVWPEPDGPTQQALSARGYRPVIVNSREEVDAQIAAYPAALFVDPLTGPITRKALQSLRQAAVAAEVPVLVTAGLGQATREAAYGADPAVLLKALAPRDSEQHPPRVLLVEEREAVAAAFAQSLERRGMQVAHAPSDSDAVNVAVQTRPNLVVMDLMQVRRRRAGIIDWLRVNGMLHRTPFVIYTSEGIDPAGLPQLATGENVLFLAERSTSDEVQSRIVDLLTKIGAH